MDDAVFQDAVLFRVFTWCLLRAAHQKVSFGVKTGRGLTIVTLEPGQLIFGRHATAKELNIPPSTVRNKIATLQSLKVITLKQDTHFSIITVINWNSYQSNNEVSGQAKDRQRTGKGHIQECKELKNKDMSKMDTSGHFDIFWGAYPRKVKPDRTKKAWQKLNPSPELFKTLMQSLEKQKLSEDWTRDRGKYIPHPSTWLNDKRWEDEIESPADKIPDDYFTRS